MTIPIPNVTADTWHDSVLLSRLPVLVEFYTDSCPHCISLAPVIEDVAQQLAGQVTVLRCDAAVEQHLDQRYGIDGVPCCIAFKSGQEKGRLWGENESDAYVHLLSFGPNLTALHHPVGDDPAGPEAVRTYMVARIDREMNRWLIPAYDKRVLAAWRRFLIELPPTDMVRLASYVS